jgi:hypothetical protein
MNLVPENRVSGLRTRLAAVKRAHNVRTPQLATMLNLHYFEVNNLLKAKSRSMQQRTFDEISRALDTFESQPVPPVVVSSPLPPTAMTLEELIAQVKTLSGADEIHLIRRH